MCELTFANLGELNSRYFLTQSIINARSNNNDGLGYIQRGKVWKTKLSAQSITNLGSILRTSLTYDPMAIHVRYATNKNLNEDCHSHPFPTDNLIVMHNGKLELKDGVGVRYTEVDSKVFTENLEDVIKETPDIPMVDLLPKVMENWYGKFAFMIYDLRDSNFYVVRGATADLNQATINGKLVVNTVAADLKKAMHDLRQQEQLLLDRDLDLGEITELDKETIYKFDADAGVLVKVGEVKENKAPLAATAWQSSTYGYQGSTLGAVTTYTTKAKPSMSKRISDFLYRYCLSLNELNEVSLAVMGCSLIELNREDLEIFDETILTALANQSSDESLQTWKDIRSISMCDWVYQLDEFSFPWMLNSEYVLSSVLELARAENKKRKGKSKK